MRYFLVDAFTRDAFSGNPAVIIPLASAANWPSDARMQALASEFNLSETAFYAAQDDGSYRLRWFTPATEVDLCGHATLAAAHVALNELDHGGDAIHFSTRSGQLTVRPDGPRLRMDFPAISHQDASDELERIGAMLGAQPDALFTGPNYLAVFEQQSDVAALEPDMAALATLEDRRGVIATAPGDAHDFVSRYFVPAAGVHEDPVTGSAHCMLAPYWSERLQQTSLRARQISARGGDVHCTVRGDRVELAGRAVTVAEGRLRT